MRDEPRLEIIKLPDVLGDEHRAERARQRDESRGRYRNRLVELLADLDSCSTDPTEHADAILDALFVVTPAEGGDACHCSCHPRLPESDFHDHGFSCSCQLTRAERGKRFDSWMAEVDAFWESPEGQALHAARAHEEAALQAWLDEQPAVTVTSHGGMAPEQWYGTVDGRSFYFRERHDQWHIELDLRPQGRFYRAWVAGDLDDDASYEEREIEEGDVIAEGTTSFAGYGTKPVERARFIVDTIREHVGGSTCDVHGSGLAELERRLGGPARWCPSCGHKLH